MHRFEYDVPKVAAFMREYLPGLRLVEGMTAIGLVRDERLVAGVLYEGFNGRNMWMHVAAEPGGRWLVRDYLMACFRYPFVVCGCERITGYVEASNAAARCFDEHLGFREEARLQGAAADGGDVILYVMRRNDCRFVGG